MNGGLFGLYFTLAVVLLLIPVALYAMWDSVKRHFPAEEPTTKRSHRRIVK